MHCLKCGKETADNQVFCVDCLAAMQDYPVKPGAAVHLPHREAPSLEKKQPARRQILTTETHTAHLRTMVRWLTAIIAVLSILLCATAGMLIHTLENQSASQTIGKNYTTAGSGNQP